MDVPPYDAASGVVWAADGVGLGASPLRSPHHLDARQPLARGDRLRIVMDGRLDDRASLVRRLEAGLDSRGGLDRRLGSSDVDLVLAAYEFWGTDCASHLLGDFSFCVWDGERRHLFCARDHLGVKPLYYARVGATLIVSSVLRSVRRHPQVSARLDEEAIGDFLLFWTCLEPSRTSFADVARVPPAHTLTASASGGSRLNRYWALQPEDSLRLRSSVGVRRALREHAGDRGRRSHPFGTSRNPDERRPRLVECRRCRRQRRRPGLDSDRAAGLYRGVRHRGTGPGTPLFDPRRPSARDSNRALRDG